MLKGAVTGSPKPYFHHCTRPAAVRRPRKGLHRRRGNKQPKTEQRAQRAPDGQDGPTDADVLYELPEDDVFVDLGEGDLSNGDNVLDGLLDDLAANLGEGEARQIGGR
jgi:hypothetical protein